MLQDIWPKMRYESRVKGLEEKSWVKIWKKTDRSALFNN